MQTTVEIQIADPYGFDDTSVTISTNPDNSDYFNFELKDGYVDPVSFVLPKAAIPKLIEGLKHFEI